MSTTSSPRPVGTRPLDLFLGMVLLGLPWRGFFSLDPAPRATFCAMNMALGIVIGFALFVVHAALIAATARALGDRVIFGSIGVGPRLWSRQWSYVTIVVRAIPANSAHAIVTTRARGQALRTALALLVAATVLATAAVLVLDTHPMGWSAMKHDMGTRLAPDVLFVVVAGWITFNAAFVIVGLLIGASGLSGVTRAVMKTRRLLGYAVEAGLQCERGAYDEAISTARRGLAEDPEYALLQAMIAVSLSNKRDPDAPSLIESLRKRELEPSLRALCSNVWAWDCYVREDAERRTEADAASREALASAPRNASYLDTRGHVLLWNGKLAEAESHLTRAYKRATAPATRTSAATGLAILCARSDRRDEALAWLGRARGTGVDHPLLARAVALVEPQRF